MLEKINARPTHGLNREERLRQYRHELISSIPALLKRRQGEKHEDVPRVPHKSVRPKVKRIVEEIRRVSQIIGPVRVSTSSETIGKPVRDVKESPEVRCCVGGCLQAAVVSVPRYREVEGRFLAVAVLFCNTHAGPFRPA